MNAPRLLQKTQSRALDVAAELALQELALGKSLLYLSRPIANSKLYTVIVLAQRTPWPQQLHLFALVAPALQVCSIFFAEIPIDTDQY